MSTIALKAPASATQADCQPAPRDRLNRMWQRPNAATMGGDIGIQRRPRDNPRDCAAHGPVERITGYRVTYEYQGKTGVRYMQKHPGAVFPIRVVLNPEP